MTAVSKEKIQEWLADMGLSPQPVAESGASWRLTVSVPPGQQVNRLEVYAVPHMPRAVIVGTRAVLTPEHIARLAALDGNAKREILQSLSRALDREFVTFNIELGSSAEDLRGFVVQEIRFDDGLSLDSLHRTIMSVYKTQIGAIQCVQRHLGG